MPMMPYDPLHRIDNLRREIDRVYRYPFSFFENDSASRLKLPFIDVYETEEQFIVSCDLPGLQSKEDVNISLQNNELVITGMVNRKEGPGQEERMHRRERFSGSFHRTITLPSDVSGDKVKAVYKNGVLNIFLPKTGGSSNKTIDIEFEH